MNCKPGDLAVIVYSTFPENIGGLCRVVEPAEFPGDWVIDPLSSLTSDFGPQKPGTIGEIGDDCLRPIRDNDGEDEMLRIVGKPEPVSA